MTEPDELPNIDALPDDLAEEAQRIFINHLRGDYTAGDAYLIISILLGTIMANSDDDKQPAEVVDIGARVLRVALAVYGSMVGLDMRTEIRIDGGAIH
jgi:hypothetical protein